MSASPIRVFLGTEPKTEIARKVLEFSIRRHTTATVQFTPMIGPAWEYDTTGFRQGTGFSLRRWMIPAFCQWEGRAIYLDADQLVFGNIQELWSYPETNPVLGCAAWMTYQPSKFSKAPHPNSSVMVLDCARAKALPYFHPERAVEFLKENPDKLSYANLMYPTWIKPGPGKLGNEWNSLNVLAAGKTKLLHYTKEPEQPWYKPDHPLAGLWRSELALALAAGVVTQEEVEEAVAKFNVKEDWRITNGLHPSYLKLLKKRDKKPDAKG